MRNGASFDVLVVAQALPGSPRPCRPRAPELASAWRPRRRCRRATRPRRREASRRRSARTTPEIHAEDVMRSSHDTASPRLVEVLTSEFPSAIHWLESLGVEFTRSNGGYRLARCGGATRKRLPQVGDRTGHAITKALREAYEAGGGAELPHHASGDRSYRGRVGRLVRDEGGPRHRGRDRRRVCRRHGVLRRAENRGELSTNHPECHRRGDESRRRPVRRAVTSTRSSTTPTVGRGRRRCRGTRSRRRRVRTAQCC